VIGIGRTSSSERLQSDACSDAAIAADVP